MTTINFQSPPIPFFASELDQKVNAVKYRIARAHDEFIETWVKLAIRAAEGGELPPILDCAKHARLIILAREGLRVFYWRDTPRLVFEHHGDFLLTVREPREGEFSHVVQ